ncbi:MAG: hypothetical protein OQK64_10390 [Ignavibacteriaceae bacterium]|nr:hypothetical protein [Ignavibacteriaceae bacterium]
MKFRSNLLLSLFVLAIILLVINVLIKSNYTATNSGEQLLDVKEIRQRFLNILDDFGIDDELIKESSSKDEFSGRKIPLVKIKLPEDLSIPEVLQDIYHSFAKDSLIFSSVEKVKNGKSTLALLKGRSAILQAEFNYVKNVYRNKGTIAFILKDIEPGNDLTEGLIESSAKLSVLIRPDSKYNEVLELIKENDKQFSILIDDDISEQKYKLGPAFSEKRVIAVVKTLVKDFSNATCFIIDDKSEFYNSPNRLIITRELNKRNIKLFTLSDFVNLDNIENIVESFGKVIENLNRDKGKVILLDETSYRVLIPEIKKYKKRGYKVLNSSQLL